MKIDKLIELFKNNTEEIIIIINKKSIDYFFEELDNIKPSASFAFSKDEDNKVMSMYRNGITIHFSENEHFEKAQDDYAIEFANWLLINDTPENAEEWFGYTNKDMLKAFKEEKGL